MRLAFLVLAAVSYALGAVSLVTNVEALATPGSELPVAYVAVALVLILRHVLSRRRVTVDVVFGALSAYLLIGIRFAFLYTGIAQADPIRRAEARTLCAVEGPSEIAYVRRREVLGGLLNEYDWAA